MAVTNYLQVLGKEDECAKHGRSQMYRSVDKVPGLIVDGKPVESSYKYLYVCMGCVLDNYQKYEDKIDVLSGDEDVPVVDVKELRRLTDLLIETTRKLKDIGK